MLKIKTSNINKIQNKIFPNFQINKISKISKIQKNFFFSLHKYKKLFNIPKKYFSSQQETQNTEDSLVLSKSEKVFSKILLRNIRYFDKTPLKSNINQPLYNNIEDKLAKNFNFSEENEELNQHYLSDENNAESEIIYSTPKSFYVDWMESNLSEGKFTIKINSQSKNIIFEDLFNNLNNIKDSSNLFVVNFDNDNSDAELLSDSEEILDENRFILDYSKEFFEENKEKKRFDFTYEFDKNKPNQLIFYCEKLFVNDVITAEEFSEIKRLPFISGRNLKYTQDQNIFENQYDNFSELLNDIRIMEKIDKIPEHQDLRIKFDLNLNYFRADHKIEAKVNKPCGVKDHYVYVITNEDNCEKFQDLGVANKVDSGEFFRDFVEMINKNNYNKKFKLLITRNNLELITSREDGYDSLIEKIENFSNDIKESDEEIISEINEFKNNQVSLKLNKNNFIDLILGDLSFSNEGLIENFNFILKNVNKLRPASVKNNYIKNISVFVNDIEFRLRLK